MYRTDDPAAEFARYDAEMSAALEHLPKCKICGDEIQQDFAYHDPIDDDWICSGCFEDWQEEVNPWE